MTNTMGLKAEIKQSNINLQKYTRPKPLKMILVGQSIYIRIVIQTTSGPSSGLIGIAAIIGE
jgi:hypothetical protein